jgi:hypothetical protein
MLTKTKIALAAALVAGAASAAAAQGFDPNLANGYPHLANPIAEAPPSVAAPRGTLQSAPVRLRESRDVALPTDRGGNSYANPIEVDRIDRASSPYAGGGY